MPEQEIEKIAAAYFASDNVIYGVRDHKKPTGLEVGLVNANETAPDEQKMEFDLRAGALGVHELLSGSPLKAVNLICPGPFRTIDKTDKELYGLIGRNAEVKHWRERNAIHMFRDIINRMDAQAYKDTQIYLYSQAGATAVGEYLKMHGEEIRNASSRGQTHKRLGNHLFVVADQLIDAALINEGEPFHGRSTMNIGHHAIIPLEDEDLSHPASICPAHPARPCLNRFASLDALKLKFGLDPERYVQSTDLNIVSRVAFYIAQMLCNVVLTTSPTRVVIGGRIKDNPMFMDLLRDHFSNLLLDHENPEIYPGYDEIKNVETFIKKQTDVHSGIKGGLAVLSRMIEKLDPDKVEQLDTYKKDLYPL